MTPARIQALLHERRRLKQQRNDRSRRSLGRRLNCSGSRMYHVVSDLDARIDDIDRQLEDLGHPVPFWER